MVRSKVHKADAEMSNPLDKGLGALSLVYRLGQGRTDLASPGNRQSSPPLGRVLFV